MFEAGESWRVRRRSCRSKDLQVDRSMISTTDGRSLKPLVVDRPGTSPGRGEVATSKVLNRTSSAKRLSAMKKNGIKREDSDKSMYFRRPSTSAFDAKYLAAKRIANQLGGFTATLRPDSSWQSYIKDTYQVRLARVDGKTMDSDWKQLPQLGISQPFVRKNETGNMQWQRSSSAIFSKPSSLYSMMKDNRQLSMTSFQSSGGSKLDQSSSSSATKTSLSLDFGVSLMQGCRPYMEDFYRVITGVEAFEWSADVMDGSASTHFFAIFDGHGGARCAKMLTTSLTSRIRSESTFQTDLPSAIRMGFLHTNTDFLKRAERQGMNDGSTAITAFIRRNKLYVANVGDSRAVLGAMGKAIPMSRDHKPNRPDERRRIVATGGHVITTFGIARVNGILAVSRAFGDYNIRFSITAEPEMKTRTLTKGDDFLILASDGLWDILSNQEAVDIVAQSLHRVGPQACAEVLVNTALQRGSMDNTSALVVDLRKLNQFMDHSPMSGKSSPIPVSPNAFYAGPLAEIHDEHEESVSCHLRNSKTDHSEEDCLRRPWRKQSTSSATANYVIKES